MSSSLGTWRLASSSAVMALGCEASQDLTTRTTGCLGSGGNFSLFALGDAPLQGCPAGEDQVALKLDDLSDGSATVPFSSPCARRADHRAERRARAARPCVLGSGIAGTASSWWSGARWTAGSRPAPAGAPRPRTGPRTRSSCSRRRRPAGAGPARRLRRRAVDRRPAGARPRRLVPDARPGIDRARRRSVRSGLPGGGHGEPDPGRPAAAPALGQPLQGRPCGYLRRARDRRSDRRRRVDAATASRVRITIGDPVTGTPATGMSPISGGIAPPLGGGISSIGGPDAAVRRRHPVPRRLASRPSAAPRRCPTAASRPSAAAFLIHRRPRPRCPTGHPVPRRRHFVHRRPDAAVRWKHPVAGRRHFIPLAGKDGAEALGI